MQTGERLLHKMFLIVLVFGFLSCAPEMSGKRKEEDKPVATECILPQEQVNTISGKWKKTPVPISFYEGSDPELSFTQEEVKEMSDAADVWNNFFKKSMGDNTSALVYGEKGKETKSQTPRPNPLCSSGGLIKNGEFTGSVVIYKIREWPHAKDAVALTSFCAYPTKPRSTIYTAIIEVNYQHFWNEGQKQPDLNSILVHEFGHLLGLDHSCDPVGRLGFPNCKDPNLAIDIKKSVVFPTVFFQADGIKGEVRRNLTTNDQGRTNCIYKEATGAVSLQSLGATAEVEASENSDDTPSLGDENPSDIVPVETLNPVTSRSGGGIVRY